MKLAPPGRVREVVRSAFWLVPSLCMVGAVLLAVALVAVDHQTGPVHTAFLFPGPPAGARSFLSAVIQAMITFTGLVFSITVVILSLTSGQFSPRVLRTFLRDRTIRLTLGAFLATFVYAMVVLREVRTGHSGVPRVAVTGTFLLVLVSVAMFIRYVAHVANMIRLASIVDSIAHDAREALPELRDAPRGSGPPSLTALRRLIAAPEPGVLAAVNPVALVALACEADSQLVLVPKVGDFVPGGGALFQVHGGEVEDSSVTPLVYFDRERTLEQDLAFAFRELVDIAQRALSPGVNDPTTATQAIDVEHDLLRRLAPLRLGDVRYEDDDSVLRLLVPAFDFPDYLDLAIGEILPYVHTAPQVSRRLRTMLDDLLTVARPENRMAIMRWSKSLARAGGTESGVQTGG